MTDQSPKDDKYNSLFCATGKVVVYWSFVEHALDQCVACAFKSAGGGLPGEAEIPRSLKKKITYFNKCLKQLESLASFNAEGRELMKQVKSLSSSRHNVVHSILYGTSQSPENLKFAKIEYTKTAHQLNRFEWSIDEITQASSQILALAENLVVYANRMAKHFYDLRRAQL